jgi:two-component system, chemotaxis family, protein-glutamate methylesterase/glutaminase
VGGIGIVQQPEDAIVAAMPRNAIQRAHPEHVAPSAAIARLILEAVNQPVSEVPRLARHGGLPMPGQVGAGDMEGTVTGLTCPECHGAIWMQNDPGKVTFECRIGHSYSPESFFEVQAENVENALWAGVRSLEEQASFASVMAARADKSGDRAARERCEARRRLASANSEVLRSVLTGRD